MSLFGKGFFVFLSNRGFLRKVVIHENRHLEVSLPQCHHEVVILWVYTPPLPSPTLYLHPFRIYFFLFFWGWLASWTVLSFFKMYVWFVVCAVILQGMYKIGWSDLLQVMIVIWMICKLIIEISNKTLIRHCCMYFQVFSALLVILLSFLLLRITQKEMEMLLCPFWNASSRITVQTISCACHEVLNFHADTGMEERCLALSVFRLAVAPKEVVLALVPRDAIESGPQTGAVDPTPALEIIVTRALDQRLVRKARLYNWCSKKIKNKN